MNVTRTMNRLKRIKKKINDLENEITAKKEQVQTLKKELLDVKKDVALKAIEEYSGSIEEFFEEKELIQEMEKEQEQKEHEKNE